jgi:hypothetical protein
MGIEEQREEREVLDSIFPDEIQDVGENGFRITIQLEVQKQNGEEESEDPVIILNVRYPEAYPDEAPMLDITQPPNAPKHAHLDIQDDKKGLLEALAPSIEENMGMAMVFQLVSALKEAAELLIEDRRNVIEKEKEQRLLQAEQEENKKFEGEKVTRERFLEWRDRFQAEMSAEATKRLAEQEAEEKKKRGGKAEEKKLTGKQLWEQGLAGKLADEDDEDGEDVVEQMRQIKVSS